jgi:signal transduction histidine kinase
MLRNLTYRTKLLVALVVPVAGLVIVAGVLAESRSDAALVVIAGCVALGWSLLATRLLTRRLRRVTAAAEAVATEHLPALVASMHAPSEDDVRYLSTTIEPLDESAGDELGRVARSVNALQTIAVDTAAARAAAVRTGVSDLYVTLVTRTLGLVENQLEVLDELETRATEPEELADLFRLDHLVTRVRRECETFLSLTGTGAPPARTPDEPVPILDVVRAAVGEVDEFARVEVRLDPADIGGFSAVDLSHVVAELVENATRFSPADSRVEVVGRRRRAGYVLSVTDRGAGMGEAALAAANAVLAQPPAPGAAAGPTVGFAIAGRLSVRHGIAVRVVNNREGGGVAAVVRLPRRLVVDDEVATHRSDDHLALAQLEDYGAGWGEESDGSKDGETAEGVTLDDDAADLDRLLVEAFGDEVSTDDEADDEPPEDGPVIGAGVDRIAVDERLMEELPSGSAGST